MSIEKKDETSSRKRRLGAITDEEVQAKVNESRRDPVKLARVHHVVKENIVTEEVVQKVKEKIMKWLSCRYPLGSKIEKISFDKTVWRDDIPEKDFWPNDSKWMPDLNTEGYESEFTYQGETFKVRYPKQGEMIRCEALENMRSLPRSVIEDLRVDVSGNPKCRVLSFVHNEDEEYYKLRYILDGTMRTLTRKY